MTTETAHTIELTVPGLYCVECSQCVESALKRVPGVEQVRILGTSEKVQLTYLSEKTGPEELLHVLERAGHPAKPVRASHGPVASSGAAAPGKETTGEPGADGPVPFSALRELHFETLRLAFIALVALIALVEIAGESLGLLRGVEELIPAPVAMAAVLLGGYPIFRAAYFGLRSRQINTALVMSVGALAAVVIGDFIAAALIVFFVSVGNYLESLTTGRSRRAIEGIVEFLRTTARVKRAGGEKTVDAEQLVEGDIVVVRPGERLPVDGTVLSGHASVNQAPITGESIPVEKEHGDTAYAGSINELGYLEIRTERIGENTTLGQIIQLVEEAEAHKAPVQRFADRFSAIFLPLVLAIAGLTLLLSHHLVAAIAVLVAACPCAVGLATPLSVVASVGAGARRGLLVKGGLALEALAKVNTLVVDKTGTLTNGRPQVTDILAFAETDAIDVLRLAAALEHYSEHPLATAVLQAASQRDISFPEARDFSALPGRGVTGEIEGNLVTLGTRRLLAEQGVWLTAPQEEQVAALESDGKTVLLLACNQTVVGALAAADTLRTEAKAALDQVRSLGIQRIILLTGDNDRVATAIARLAGITEVRANQLPEDKIALVRQLQQERCRVAFVGDGVNDAPALTQADVGIAMGASGTGVALEAADVALMRDDWMQVPEAIRMGRRTYTTIRQNIGFGIAFNVLVIGLAALGFIGPVIAAASQSVPDVAVALNAARLLRPATSGRSTRARGAGAPDAQDHTSILDTGA